MDKKIAMTTWVTDDYAEYIGLEYLKNSFKYFHPDIDFLVVDTKKTKEIIAEYPWIMRGEAYGPWGMAPQCMLYIDDYDMVIHLDGDAVVTGPMDEFFNSKADVVGVRNNNSFNKAGSHNGITIPHIPPFGDGSPIPMQGFVNAGLIGVNRKEFWYDWQNVNTQIAATGMSDENDTLNYLFHWDKYTSEIVDAMGTNVSYGISNCWGNDPRNHWESWELLYVKDNRLYLDDPVTGDPMCVKVLHLAGGGLSHELCRAAGGFRPWLSSIVTDEVNDYINEISHG